jgi:hypothetical protein
VTICYFGDSLRRSISRHQGVFRVSDLRHFVGTYLHTRTSVFGSDFWVGFSTSHAITRSFPISSLRLEFSLEFGFSLVYACLASLPHYFGAVWSIWSVVSSTGVPWSSIGLDTIALGLCGLVLWIQEAPLVVDCVSLFSACISFTFGGFSLGFLCLDPLHSCFLFAHPVWGSTLFDFWRACVGPTPVLEYLLLCAVGSEAGVMTSRTIFVSSR